MCVSLISFSSCLNLIQVKGIRYIFYRFRFHLGKLLMNLALKINTIYHNKYKIFIKFSVIERMSMYNLM